MSTTMISLRLSDDRLESCVATFDNIDTVDKRWFVERICTLPPHRLPDVRRALRIAVDC